MYPLKIRITEPELIEAFKGVSNFRTIKINPNLCKSIGHKIPRIVKKDGVFIKDGRFGIDNPKLSLSYKPAYGKRGGFDFEFKTII